MAPLEPEPRLSETQALFYTPCQRAAHEYVCERGRSHNLCKVSSCIMQPIYASPGWDCAEADTHAHTRIMFTTVLCWTNCKSPNVLHILTLLHVPVHNHSPAAFTHPHLLQPALKILAGKYKRKHKNYMKWCSLKVYSGSFVDMCNSKMQQAFDVNKELSWSQWKPCGRLSHGTD